MSEEQKLLPCPFCGGTNLILRKVIEFDKPSMNDHYRVGCSSIDKDGWVCGAVLQCGGSKNQMIEKWNCRTTTNAQNGNTASGV